MTRESSLSSGYCDPRAVRADWRVQASPLYAQNAAWEAHSPFPWNARNSRLVKSKAMPTLVGSPNLGCISLPVLSTHPPFYYSLSCADAICSNLVSQSLFDLGLVFQFSLNKQTKTILTTSEELIVSTPFLEIKKKDKFYFGKRNKEPLRWLHR